MIHERFGTLLKTIFQINQNLLRTTMCGWPGKFSVRKRLRAKWDNRSLFSFSLSFNGLRGQRAEENQRNQYTNREQAQKKSQYSFNHLHQSSRQNGLWYLALLCDIFQRNLDPLITTMCGWPGYYRARNRTRAKWRNLQPATWIVVKR
jgi:hypothetical protein